ncbi:MAG: hypothetical protein ACOCSQ_03150 [Planctomycetota bacterium]
MKDRTMSRTTTTTTEDMGLPWEELGKHRAAGAFFRTAIELSLHPIRFTRRMSSDGGLHEPLLFFWLIVSMSILVAFPLALSYFSLAAPPAESVSREAYNLHLLPPRITGFLVIILPVILLLGALSLITAGTVFYLAGRFFGVNAWEAAVSIWCYAKCSAMVPVVMAEILVLLITVTCYVISRSDPGMMGLCRQTARISLIAGALTALLLSAGLFFTHLIAGTIQVFHLDPASGTAAALAGTAMICFAAWGPIVSLNLWGIRGAATATSSMLFLLVVLWISGWLFQPIGESQPTDSMGDVQNG